MAENNEGRYGGAQKSFDNPFCAGIQISGKVLSLNLLVIYNLGS